MNIHLVLEVLCWYLKCCAVSLATYGMGGFFFFWVFLSPLLKIDERYKGKNLNVLICLCNSVYGFENG
jgi:hypothetical protein